jgi:hypothetical protein
MSLSQCPFQTFVTRTVPRRPGAIFPGRVTDLVSVATSVNRLNRRCSVLVVL